jgi:hypothetical protein
MAPSRTHLVLVPSYNTGGALLRRTVESALAVWRPVWVVIDGSSDDSPAVVLALAEREPGLRVIVRTRNGGKGAAVQTGVEAALAAGFTHVLTMDSDGQHPVSHVPEFMAASQAAPAAMILGRPVFGPEVPLERLHGRKLSVGLVRAEILGAGIDDPLFGFRVYPAAPLQRMLARLPWARGFTFDPEVAVRLFWAGVPARNLPAPCRYVPRGEGGVSHFRYGRDNLKMIWLHTRLLAQLLWRWPAVRRVRRVGAALVLACSGLLPLGVPVRAEAAPEPAGAAASAGAGGAGAGGAREDDPVWAALFTTLAQRGQGSLAGRFEEHRWFPFRKDPLVLQGELRLAPGHGLSLHYTAPEERTLVLDAEGLLLRDARGRSRAPPADPRAEAGASALRDVLRFDLAALRRTFVISGTREGESWQLVLVPKPGPEAPPLERLEVRGTGGDLAELTLRRSGRQRIDIKVRETRDDAVFGAAERARFFR